MMQCITLINDCMCFFHNIGDPPQEECVCTYDGEFEPSKCAYNDDGNRSSEREARVWWLFS